MVLTVDSDSLSNQSLVSVVGVGLVVYLIFKRTEASDPLSLVLLLIAVPATLTAFVSQHALSILSAVAITFTLFWSTIAVSIIVYRLSPWHPLAKYPGPILCKLTKFYWARVAFGGKQHERYMELHRKYGDIVRVGPNELSVTDAAAVEQVMGSNGLPKGPWWDGRRGKEGERPMVSLRDKAEHARRRRPWTRAFSSNALKGYEDLITKRCLQLVESIGKQKGAVNMSMWISFWSYDLMGDLAFGGGTEMIRDGDVDGIWRLLEARSKIAIFMSHIPWLGSLFLQLPRVAADHKTFRDYSIARAIDRKNKGSPHKDLFYYFSDEGGFSSNPPSIAETVSDGELAIVAGSDTTSNTITIVLFLILTHPKEFRLLQAEIDGLGDELMDYKKHGQLSYLNAVINEALRLYPVILSGSPRYTEPGSGGRLIRDNFIPECTSIFMPQYVLHRDPRYFSLPDSFVPERWLSRKERIELEPEIFKNQEDFRHDITGFIPFSAGPANCVGKNLAYMEMRMLICLLLRRYDMKLEEGYHAERWDENILDYFLMFKDELPVYLTRRST